MIGHEQAIITIIAIRNNMTIGVRTDMGDERSLNKISDLQQEWELSGKDEVNYLTVDHFNADLGEHSP